MVKIELKKNWLNLLQNLKLGCTESEAEILECDNVEDLIKTVWNKAIEQAHKVTIETEEAGDYTRGEDGYSYWETSSEATRSSIADNIEKLKL